MERVEKIKVALIVVTTIFFFAGINSATAKSVYAITDHDASTLKAYKIQGNQLQEQANIYGYGFQYNPLTGDYGGGQLTGFWMDDTPFSIDLWYSSYPGAPIIDTYAHIVLIPEPATLLLLGSGGLFLRKI